MIRERFSKKPDSSKSRLKKWIFGCLFAIMASFGLNVMVPVTTVYAEPETTQTTTTDAGATTGTTGGVSTENAASKADNGASCENNLGAIGWLVCPSTGVISKAVDTLYGWIENILVINPVEIKDGSPVYEVWKYMLMVGNIVFIIFFLVVIYSQITGMGISNYGIKKALPKIIVVAILANLSFIICSLAVDLSNIIGNGMRDVFATIESSTSASMSVGAGHVSMAEMYGAMAGGGALAVGAGMVAFDSAAIWMLIPTVLGAIVAVVIGVITIAMRQAVVVLLIMVAPLAMVSYLLPNTEDWFKKWKQLFIKMLVFYPMFSLLFGASSLAGWAIIASANNGFWIILGVAVQIFPLFFAVSLMKMSGTFLSTINSKLHGMMAKPLAMNRAWADSNRQLMKQKNLAKGNVYSPSLRLMQFMSNRRIMREEETAEHAATVKLRGQAYAAMRNYKADGTPSGEGEEAYAEQAQNLRYKKKIEWHKNNMNKGMGQLEAVKNRASVAQRARLDALDAETVDAADSLFAETARGEMIERRNAEGRHKRFEAAINAHMDDLHGYITDGNGDRVKNKNYKLHFKEGDTARIAATNRYNNISEIMEGDVLDVQYAVASAAQAFDTQAKIVNSKFQKYFELVPPTQDLEYRLREFSRHVSTDPNFKVTDNMDTIIAGLRMINMRGDTDIVKSIMDDMLDKKYGGLELGTHASQSLASFLMFEVKDNDPFLRRFGKYINLETARAYNEGELRKGTNRKEMNITYDEYVKGYHVEPNGKLMYAKKDMKKLVEGTSLDNIERTALSNLDDSLKKAYGYDASNPSAKWDVEKWIDKRKEIQTAFEPAFLSASLKWLSGSEQINSAVKFWTGYDLKQKKDDEGNNVVDKNGDPVYELSPVWKDKEFAGHEKEVEDYYRDRTMAYFKDQTTGQILGMRTDYRDPTMEHLVEEYLNGKSDDETSEERKRKYEEARAEIQSRYGDMKPEDAQKKRADDLKKLKMELAGKQLRKILGETGKLKQIYRTRTSGTAINAKDWLRGWVNLDNEDALREEMNYYDRLKKEKEDAKRKLNEEEERKGADTAEEQPIKARIYNEDDRERFVNEMQDLKDKILDEEPIMFYEGTRGKLIEWFGEDTEIVKKYEHFHDVDDPSADNIELYKFVKELLEDMDNYPDA